jgi:glycosyltransferase involved in cell wall biosynthesis
MKHCIVTPDFIGPVNNGGIGTACYLFARFLSLEKKEDVEILFTGPIEVKNLEYWKEKHRADSNLAFHWIDETPRDSIQAYNSTLHHQKSLQIHNWLKDKEFDFIHFQEWQGNGFVAIQSKKSAQNYLKTVFTVTMHSSTQWLRDGMNIMASGDIDEILLDYYERYSAKNADITIFPSMHMKNWARINNWEIPEDKSHIINYISKTIYNSRERNFHKVKEICFFGRLETRKGLEIFIDAILNVRNKLEENKQLPKITFLGKNSTTAYGASQFYIKSKFEVEGVDYQIIDDKSSEEAIEYLKSDGCIVAVIPSLQDNLPLTVIECINNNIPFIASDVGGIPELIKSQDNIFKTTKEDLTRILLSIVNNGIQNAQPLYNNETNIEKWNEILNKKPTDNSIRIKIGIAPHEVTICIPNYNYGKYLLRLIKSLDSQSINGFHVLIVDDGSTDLETINIISEIESLIRDKKSWNILRKENSGVCSTRNYAVRNAPTDWVLFVDADNIPRHDMVESFCRSADSEQKISTCYFKAFENEADIINNKFLYSYTPTGGCTEAGLYTNYYGDANFLVNKNTFFKIGGFTETKYEAFADWEFLARASLNGYDVDVIPDYLFYYRHLPTSMMRNSEPYHDHKLILDAYTANLPVPYKRILEGTYLKVHHHLRDLVQKGNVNKIKIKNSREHKYINILIRLFNALTGRFDETKYIHRNSAVLLSQGFVRWIKYPRIHYALFNLPY